MTAEPAAPAAPEPSPAGEGEPPPLGPLTSPLERRVLALELAVVLGLLWLPSFAISLFPDQAHWRLEHVPHGCLFCAAAIALLVYLVWRNRESWQTLGLRPHRWWQEALFGVLACTACWTALLFLDKLRPASWTRSSVPPFPLAGLPAAPVYLLLAFYEEVLYRGYVWNRIEQLTGRPALAITGSAVLFTVMHAYNWADLVLAILPFGLLMGLFYWAFRSVIGLALAHAAYNLWFAA